MKVASAGGAHRGTMQIGEVCRASHSLKTPACVSQRGSW